MSIEDKPFNAMEYNPLRAKFQEELLRRGIWSSCVNCEHWSATYCTKYNSTPPTDVLVVGCPEWQEVIPF